MKEYIYGKNTVKEAMLSNKNVSKLYVTKNNEDFISLAKKKQIDFSIADNGYLNKLANGNHQGVRPYLCNLLPEERSSYCNVVHVALQTS